MARRFPTKWSMALRTICIDDMGYEAARDGLRLIKLRNVKDKAGMRMSFEGGVPEMQCAYALRTEGMRDDGAIRYFIGTSDCQF